jgi:hypothetical protein
MTQTPHFALARHSETLEWFQVSKTVDDEISEGFIVRQVDERAKITFTLPLPDFTPTHVHYKGHGYRRYADVHFKGNMYVFYGDAEGNYWLRPLHMFEGCLEDGTVRFRVL